MQLEGRLILIAVWVNWKNDMCLHCRGRLAIVGQRTQKVGRKLNILIRIRVLALQKLQNKRNAKLHPTITSSCAMLGSFDKKR